MKHIVDDLSPTSVTAAIRANLYAFFRYLGRSASVEFHATPELVRWHTGLGHPWFNGVLSTNEGASDPDTVIAQTLAYFRSRNVGHFTWWFDSGLEAFALRQRLLTHGFVLDEDTPGMAMDLATLDGAAQKPAGLMIARVEDDARLQEWVRTCLAGFEFPARWEAPFFDLMAGLGIGGSLWHYVGYLDGRPVATSTLFVAAGVAGVQFVGTVPEARGRGIGGAMTLAALLDARALDYRIGILQASAMGVPVYRRLGFHACCQMSHYTAGPQVISG
jgi:GNAT superfamily N-acetyltransferase